MVSAYRNRTDVNFGGFTQNGLVMFVLAVWCITRSFRFGGVINILGHAAVGEVCLPGDAVGIVGESLTFDISFHFNILEGQNQPNLLWELDLFLSTFRLILQPPFPCNLPIRHSNTCLL